MGFPFGVALRWWGSGGVYDPDTLSIRLVAFDAGAVLCVVEINIMRLSVRAGDSDRPFAACGLPDDISAKKRDVVLFHVRFLWWVDFGPIPLQGGAAPPSGDAARHHPMTPCWCRKARPILLDSPPFRTSAHASAMRLCFHSSLIFSPLSAALVAPLLARPRRRFRWRGIVGLLEALGDADQHRAGQLTGRAADPSEADGRWGSGWYRHVACAGF